MAEKKEIRALSKIEDSQQPHMPSPRCCGRDLKLNPTLRDPEERTGIIALIEGKYRQTEEIIKV